MKEARVSLVEALEVLPLDVLLEFDAAPGDALEQHVDRGLQVHDEIRLRRADVEPGVELLVEGELGVLECHSREQPVLLEQVVRHAQRREQVRLLERGELLGALQQEVQLCRQGAGARVAVEALEERVLRRLLEHPLGGEADAQASREARLADTDRTLDDDEPMRGFAPHALTTG